MEENECKIESERKKNKRIFSKIKGSTLQILNGIFLLFQNFNYNAKNGETEGATRHFYEGPTKR
jgi:hypothetical protein